MQYDFEQEQLLAPTQSKQTAEHDLLTADKDNLPSLIEKVAKEYSSSISHYGYSRKLQGVSHAYRRSSLVWRATVMVGDITIFGSLLLLMLLVLHFHPDLLILQNEPIVWHPKVVLACLALLSWSVATRITQAYEINNLYERLASPFCALLSFSIMFIFLVLLGYPFVVNESFYLEILFAYLLAAIPVLCVWRVMVATIMNFPRFRPRAVIIGTNTAAESVAREFQRAKRYTANILGYISANSEAFQGDSGDIPVLGDQAVLRTMAQQGLVDMIIMAVDYRTNPGLFQEAIEWTQFGITVVPMTTAYERISGKISVENIGDQWYVALPAEANIAPFYHVWRKTLDIIFGVLGMIVLLLLLPILATCIYLDSPGPIFYKQERMGRNGRKFTIYKFRSMHTDSEFTGRATWASKGDPRVTRIGRFMRATHMDELPQVWNILCGEMSLIGPRPERQEFVATLERSIPFYLCRMSVKPGLTGWAQVKYGYGNSNQDALEKLQYDLYYIKHQSFMLDIFIILRTVVEVCLRRGM